MPQSRSIPTQNPPSCKSTRAQSSTRRPKAKKGSVRVADQANWSELTQHISSFIQRRSFGFAKGYCLQQWASKLVLKGSVDTRAVAIEKFIKMEGWMQQVNFALSGQNPASATIKVAREKIRRLIPESAVTVANLVPGARFTGGACFHMSHSASGTQDKYGDVLPTVTLSCARLFAHMIKGTLIERNTGNRVQLVRGSRITTVPKNAKTDRTIEVNPSGNVYCQKGLAQVIRNRLLKVGIDLNDQTPNRERARVAMFSGHATLDLRNASDSISLELARQILPDYLFDLVLMMRCDEYLLNGEWHECHKLSSMGNAATFEIETLIFWALCSAYQSINQRSSDVLVYGDDIIVPCDDVPGIRSLFDLVGFELNPNKSFWDVCFRESCGLHSFLGQDVTPFYVKAIPSSALEWVILINKIRRWDLRMNSEIDETDPLWRVLFRYIPDGIRHSRIPDGFGDGAPIGVPVFQYRDGLRLCRVIRARTKRSEAPQTGGLIASLALTNDHPISLYDRVNAGALSQCCEERSTFRETLQVIPWQQ